MHIKVYIFRNGNESENPFLNIKWQYSEKMAKKPKFFGKTVLNSLQKRILN